MYKHSPIPAYICVIDLVYLLRLTQADLLYVTIYMSCARFIVDLYTLSLLSRIAMPVQGTRYRSAHVMIYQL